ncbi:MAG: FG-GAP-like repeat-containing protein, partial [Bacteroidota bacterium]
ELGGDKLYRNDGGTFQDVSEEAGIYGSVIGFGLGVTVGDLNVDGWPDIYVSNDFFERDYLYINQGNGTFSEELTERIDHLSHFSMGADVGDLNNDGSPELFVTDMLPASQRRLKSLTKYDTYDFYQAKVQNGYHEQVMRNTLQLNNGDGTFREIGQYAGVHATDWSWGAVLADFDNDGTMEILVANGVFRDVTDQDFIDYLANEENMRQAMETGTVDFSAFVDKMPSQKIPNYLFHRGDNMRYVDSASAWGLAEPSFSNGAAYGDLDNDGDLDLVINNVNQDLFLYRNNAEALRSHNYLKVNLEGEGQNSYGVGARVVIHTPQGTYYRENMPMRGFQSSMDYGLTVGLGKSERIDSVVVTWGPTKKQSLTGVAVNSTLVVSQKDATVTPDNQGGNTSRPFTRTQNQLAFQHAENAFVDWDRERMIYHMLSTEGPALAKGDVNGDGLEDVFIGGAVGQAGQIYLQQPDGSFAAHLYQEDLTQAAAQEDVDAALFDADGDGDLDLYVVRGGGQFVSNHPSLQDGFYLNNGQGTFVASRTIPRYAQAGACVTPGDYDADGDLDLFIGVRHIPGKYGLAPGSHLLQNDGKGNFTDVGNTLMFGLESLGMITEAVWSDYDRDDDLDLLVVGEWMPLVIYKNTGQNFERLNNVPGLDQLNGWWNALTVSDLDGDGVEDYLLGNWGQNTRYRATKEEPLSLFIKDIDQNGTLDHIFTQYADGEPYTIALKHDLEMQLNYLSKRFVYYKDFAGKPIDSVFSEQELADAIRQGVNVLP